MHVNIACAMSRSSVASQVIFKGQLYFSMSSASPSPIWKSVQFFLVCNRECCSHLFWYESTLTLCTLLYLWNLVIITIVLYLFVYFSAIGDKQIEVIGVESALHAGQVKAGIRASGRRLAQCSNVTIRTHKRFPMQIDGEPWLQPPCTVSVILVYPKKIVPLVHKLFN